MHIAVPCSCSVQWQGYFLHDDAAPFKIVQVLHALWRPEVVLGVNGIGSWQELEAAVAAFEECVSSVWHWILRGLELDEHHFRRAIVAPTACPCFTIEFDVAAFSLRKQLDSINTLHKPIGLSMVELAIAELHGGIVDQFRTPVSPIRCALAT